MDIRNAELDKLSSMLLNSGLACSATEARRMAQSMTSTERKVQESFQANRDLHLKSFVKRPTPDNPAYLPSAPAATPPQASPLYTEESRANLTALWQHRPDPGMVAAMKQRAPPAPVRPSAAPPPIPAQPASSYMPAAAPAASFPRAEAAVEMRQRALNPAPVHIQTAYDTPAFSPAAILPDQTYTPPQPNLQQVFHIPRQGPAPAPSMATAQELATPYAAVAPLTTIHVHSDPPAATFLETTTPAPDLRPWAPAAAPASPPPPVVQPAPSYPAESAAAPSAPDITLREIMDEDAMRIYAAPPSATAPQAGALPPRFHDAILENAPNPSYNYVNPRLEQPSLPAALPAAPAPEARPEFMPSAPPPAASAPTAPAPAPSAAQLLDEAEELAEQTAPYVSPTTASAPGPGKADAPEAKVDLSEMFNFAKRR